MNSLLTNGGIEQLPMIASQQSAHQYYSNEYLTLIVTIWKDLRSNIHCQMYSLILVAHWHFGMTAKYSYPYFYSLGLLLIFSSYQLDEHSEKEKKTIIYLLKKTEKFVILCVFHFIRRFYEPACWFNIQTVVV